MTPTCENAVQGIGSSLSASLLGVDCMAGEMSQQAFSRLFGSEGQLVPALTILLTIFIALFGFALLTGRTNIGIRSLVPRMMTLGLVLTFATSWIAFQSVVWNLALGAPDQIASILTGSNGSATVLFAEKIDIVFTAISDIAANQQGGAEDSGGTMFSPVNLMWIGAMLFLLGTVGVLVTCRIALAVLVALGPIFVVLALFNGTRGMFVGWLKGVVLLALAPLLAVLSGSLMLEMTVPIINALSPFPGEIDPRAAFAFFLVGFVHVALMVLAVKTSTTMVSGWSVFGLGNKQTETGASAATVQRSMTPAMVQNAQAAQAAAPQNTTAAPRRAEISGAPIPAAANDSGSGTSALRRETRIFTTSQSGETASPPSGQSRTRGIGSRFRPAPPKKSEFVK